MQDLFGGDIYKFVDDESVGSMKGCFFNVVDENVIDLTATRLIVLLNKKGIAE